MSPRLCKLHKKQGYADYVVLDMFGTDTDEMNIGWYDAILWLRAEDYKPSEIYKIIDNFVGKDMII